MAKIITSLVIPTLDREPIVLSTLNILKKEIDEATECLVIDQSDKPSNHLETFGAQFPNYRYIHLKEKGLPNARNVGISESVGDIIIFIDDDVVPIKGFVGYHLKNYRDENVAGIGGKVIEDSNIFNTGGKYIGGKINFYGRSQRNFESDQYGETEWGAGCNFSVRRSALADIIKFDVAYSGTAVLEEADFFEQLRKYGGKIFYDPKSELKHLRAQIGGCRQLDRNVREYWRFHNAILFFLKHRSAHYFPVFMFYYFLLLLFNVIRGNVKLSHVFKILGGFWDGISTYRKNRNKYVQYK